MSDVSVNPISYSFEGDGVVNNNLNVAPGNPPTFEFSTNASGQIDGWGVLLVGGPHSGGPFGDGDVEFEIFSNPSGILNPNFPFISEDEVHESLDIEGFSFSFVPGTWAESGTGVPEPSTVTLLVAGMIGLLCVGFRKHA